MTEFVLLALLAGLGVVLMLVWLASPWKSLLGWVALLGVQLNTQLFFSGFRPALSDLFVPSLALSLLLVKPESGSMLRARRSRLPAAVLLFAGLFLILGNTFAYLDLGTIPQWTWLNKDIGLLNLLFCFFAMLQLLNSSERLLAITRVFVLSVSALNVVAVAGGIARYAFGIPNMMMRENTSLRLVGFMVNPNSYGGFVLCVLLMQFALLLSRSRLLPLPRRAQQLNLVLLGMACVMTLSRSTLLGLAMGMIGLLWFYRFKGSMRLMGWAVVVLAGMTALVSWYAASPGTSSVFWDNELNTRTITDRLDSNKAALDMLVRGSPLRVVTGVGVGTFLTRSQQYIGIPLLIHNDFLWLLVETGLWGLLLFGAMMLTSLRNCVEVARLGAAESAIAISVACALVGTLGWMLGTQGLWHRHVWFLLALSEACYRLRRKDVPAFSAHQPGRFQQAPSFVYAADRLGQR